MDLRVRASDPRYWEVCEFLWDEATMLDEGDLDSWCTLMAPDLRYRVPVRVTAERGTDEFSTRMFHADDTFLTLTVKMQRLTSTTSGWAESPPSRTRRIISGFRVERTATDDEYRVSANVVMLRFRYDRPEPELLSDRRDDRLRLTDDGWRIAERTFFLDQTTLATGNLALPL